MSFLDKELIAFDVEANNSDDIIRLGADLLYRNHYVKEGYGDAVREREKEYPTGLPGNEISVAIPHTTCGMVYKPAVAVMIPKQPIEFIQMGTIGERIDCEIVFMLVIKDSNEQLTMLKKVMQVIQNGELLRKIKRTKDKNKIIEYLSLLDEQ
jgi:PTS system galactitol-specific IIA component